MSERSALILVLATFTGVGLSQNERPPERPRIGPPPEILERFDQDGDGRLNEAERAALRAELGDPPPRPGGRPPGPGMGGGPGGERERELVPKFDLDGDGVLNAEERAVARQFVKENPSRRGPGPGGRRRGPGGRGAGGPGFPGGPGGPGGPGEQSEAPRPGERLSPDQVAHHPDAELYDDTVIQTIFLDFESDDWEAEMADFYRTDVEVPARLTIDGITLEHPVGVGFRGNSSFFSVSDGSKRSLNVSIDTYADGQRLKGYRTLNLLNGHVDPSFLREGLFSHIASRYVPMYKVNWVRVVLNGENWGIYVNAQQFNKDFLVEHYGTRKGVRWKVPAGPGGGFRYEGDDLENYQGGYQLKTNAKDGAWERMIALCKSLHDATPETAMETLAPILDVDEALWFLAVDNVFQDSDGYLSRASDYVFYEDPDHRFHVLPYDSNETFRANGGGGPGLGRPGGRPGVGPGGFPPFRGGPGAGGPRGEGPGGEEGGARPAREADPDGPRRERLGEERGGPGPGGPRPGPGGEPLEPFGRDPLTGADDERLPLAKALLSVPALRARYLHHVRVIAEDWLSWKQVEPVAMRFHNLIREEVAKDTRKLYSTEAFEKSLTEEIASGRRATPSLKEFIEERAEYLKSHAALAVPVPIIKSITTGLSVEPGETVRIEAVVEDKPPVAVVVLHYRVGGEGVFSRFAMERVEGSYVAEVPAATAGALVEYYVEARTAGDEAASFAPRYGERAPASYRVAIVPGRTDSPVILNELMAGNLDTIADPQGDYDDWLELHNRSDEVVDLSGYTLSDSEDNLAKWTFPDGSTIAPGGFLLVWADEDGGKKKRGLHANFKLSKSGEIVVLSDPSGTVLDVIRFDALPDGSTYARQGDSWAVGPATPARGNQPAVEPDE